MKRTRGSLLLRIVVIFVVVFAVIKLVQLDREIDEAKAALQQYEQSIDREKREIAIYNEALSQDNEDEFIEQVARDEFGYAASDEQIFIPIS